MAYKLLGFYTLFSSNFSRFEQFYIQRKDCVGSSHNETKKVFTFGIARSLLVGKHVKRTRYAYQLTLAWLHVLKVKAYNEYCQEEWGPHESVEMWEK